MEITEQKNMVWTIGHSTRTIDEFVGMLKSFDIQILADIRSFPGSKRYPHFNKDALKAELDRNHIEYIHFKDLGGRRQTRPDSVNTGWRHAAFKGYADYMETGVFKHAIRQLGQVALKKRLVYMCSEAVWWSCHRSLVSDYLKVHDWTVMHIMGLGKADEHPYTAPARVINGELVYHE